MNPVQILAPAHPMPAPGNGMLFRQLTHQLRQMQDLIVESGLQDRVTREIELWGRDFLRDLQRSDNDAATCALYIARLQGLLRNPLIQGPLEAQGIVQPPLDGEAMLGSDGHTYGHQWLAVHQALIPQELKNRSPMHPNDPAPFEAAPHPVARHMVDWLKRRDALLQSEALERAYLQLGPLPLQGEHNNQGAPLIQQVLRNMQGAAADVQARNQAKGKEPRAAPAEGVVLDRPQAIHDGALRRRLHVELIQLQEEIARSGLRDEMTRHIAKWQEDFREALNVADVEAVYKEYIQLLQELLFDPITFAPLDLNALLGSDGHTYGQMGLAVFALAVPKKYRDRSPLDAGNPAPLRVQPHPVARHAAGWLKAHDALQYSEELEKAYLELLPKPPPLDDRNARMARLIARQQELNGKEAVRRKAYGEEIENKLKEMAARDEQDIQRLHAKLDAIAGPFAGVQAQVKEIKVQEGAELANLEGRVVAIVHQGFEHVQGRIKAFANNAAAEIQKISAKDQVALQQFEQKAKTLQVEIHDLTQRNEALRSGQVAVVNRLKAVQHEERVLQQKINETKIAVREMKERSSNQLIAGIAVVGGCIFTTWVLIQLAPAGALVANIHPLEGGGAALGAVIPL